MRWAVLLVAVGAMIATTGQAAAQDRKAELGKLVFGLCPKLLDGSVLLTDPGQLSVLGFTAMSPRETPSGNYPRVEQGTGPSRIVLSANADTCSVWFGGPDNPTAAGGIMEQAYAAKFKGGSPQHLGDGTLVFFLKQKESGQTVLIILADAGGQLDFTPATTVIVMKEKR